MKADKISESGIISGSGKLLMPMDRLNAFFAANKGRRVVVRFEAVAPGSTAAQHAYFYNYILPEVQGGLLETGERMSEEMAERFLLNNYPGDIVGEGGISVSHARQLDMRQMSDFLDWVKEFAAENLSVYIEDPRTI